VTNFLATPPTTAAPAAAPRAAVIAGSHPNPFNPATTIVIELPQAAAVTLRVHDAAGRLVRTLASAEAREAGRYEIAWNGRDEAGRAVPAGVYLARLRAGSDRDTARLVLVK
jgi:flagellar hook assembly protein FlgD